MSDSGLLARYAHLPEDDRGPVEVRSESEPRDDLGSFGWLRGARERAAMLELRRKDGRILAMGYGWLERAEFDPSEGIVLHFAGRDVRIAGRNLNGEIRPSVRLFEGITKHRVPWIREASRADLIEAGPDACLIETIGW